MSAYNYDYGGSSITPGFDDLVDSAHPLVHRSTLPNPNPNPNPSVNAARAPITFPPAPTIVATPTPMPTPAVSSDGSVYPRRPVPSNLPSTSSYAGASTKTVFRSAAVEDAVILESSGFNAGLFDTNSYLNYYHHKSAVAAGPPMSGVGKTLMLLQWMATAPFVGLYKIFFTYPIVYAIDGMFGAGLISQHNGYKAMLYWTMFVVCILYGFQQAAAYENWMPSHYTDIDAVMLGLARASGLIVSVCAFLSVILSLKFVNSTLAELPEYKKQPINWRKAHIQLFWGMVFAAVIHTVGHVVRVAYTNKYYVNAEVYSLATGIVLFILCAAQAIPLITIRLKMDWGKTWFRRSHSNIAACFLILYALHAYRVFTIMLFFLWSIDYAMHNTTLSEIQWRFRGTRRSDGKPIGSLFPENLTVVPQGSWAEYVLELEINCRDFIPRDYGLFYQLKLGTVTSSYTVTSRLSRTDEPILEFRINKCFFSEYFADTVRDLQLHHVDVEHRMDQNNPSRKDPCWWRMNNQQLRLQAVGPYHSTDYALRQPRDIIVLTSGIGSTVARSISRCSARGNWDRVRFIHLAGRKQQTPVDVSRTAQTINPDIPDLMPINNVPSMVDLTKSINLPGKDDYDRDRFPRLVFIVTGQVELEDVSKLLVGVDPSFHFVICGRLWGDMWMKIKHQDVLPGFLQRVHVETFDI